MSPSRRAAILLLLGCLGFAGAEQPLGAERLPVRRYSTSDGLAGGYVIDIFRDSRGFLWFSTRDGLSRFDGVRFVTYTMADGLPHATVNGVMQTRDGTYWICTNGGGIARFSPDGQPRFTAVAIGDSIPANRVNVLYEDRAGRLWAGTDNGLYLRDAGDEQGAFRPARLPVPRRLALDGVNEIVEDAEGSLWVSGVAGIRRRLPDGRVVLYQLDMSGDVEPTTALRIDASQRLWIGFSHGILVTTPEPASRFGGESEPLVRLLPRPSPSQAQHQSRGRWYTADDGLPSARITALHESTDGRLWAGTIGGIAEFDNGRFRAHPPSSGLPDDAVSSFADDEAGNLWIATVSGVMRLIRHGLVTYDEADGLGDSRVRAIAQGPDGVLKVVTGDFQINEYNGRRFTARRLPLPPNAGCTWMSPCGYLDRSGGWWLLTTMGLRYWSAGGTRSSPAERPADRVLLEEHGLASTNAFTMFGDSRGRLWIATSPNGIALLDADREQVRTLSEADGLPPAELLAGRANVFVEDHAGHIWIGFEGAGLARERDGRFERLGEAAGVPLPFSIVTALHVDAAGRLWIASSRAGLGRIDDPEAADVRVRWITTANGLASDNVRAIVADGQGRIYAGTSLGVDRVDPATGAVTHFTEREGLGSQFVTAAFRDQHGTLWFGTISGLSRLDPLAGPPAPIAPAPPVFIAGLRVAGTPLPVSELGEAAPAGVELPPTRNQLEIEYFGLDFQSGAPLRYQYRLEGADADWSAPTTLRTVNYAQLAPGSYRFLVRSVRPDGQPGPAPAVVAFRVRPPFYATWWFLAIAAVAAGGLGVVGYRMRVAQLLRVERVRARIATDLHDDIGASLSQIAILAEVARQQQAGRALAPGGPDPLARIAETSRELVDSMSDIVWAINPQVDTLSDLVHRMRRFVEDTLGSAEIDVTFTAPDEAQDLHLGADVRREVFLILKESVTNIATHAGAATVTIALAVDRRRLRLQVADDGRGFDPAAGTDGNGVASMRRRVAALGGALSVDSAPGRGTTIRLEVDL
jgi:ligand-binding sensor domain-containing protein/two-component sensor histidine kinase